MKPVPSKSRYSAAPLGQFLKGLVGASLAKRGLGESSLLTHWADIVGARIAGFAQPIEMQWPPRPQRRDPEAPASPATLVLRVDGAFALEAQHSSAIIVERVNAHLGWRCIEKIAFRQGPLDELRRPSTRKKAPSASARAKAEALAAPIEAQGLREALAKLGARIIDNGDDRG